MDKRYQVFVSSTYTDLLEERAEVMQALLELDCMPAGMELFPAANEEQWSWIKKVIDISDYYIVIAGGRYGSISESTGRSYTEMEYQHAVDIGKPIIGFLHQEPEKISSGKTEHSEEGRAKLVDFRQLIEKRLCKYWNNPSDLGAKVSRSLTQLIKHNPTAGWVRADQVEFGDSKEILRLHREIESLQQEILKLEAKQPDGTVDLSQGDDLFLIEFSYETKLPKIGRNGSTYWVRGEEYNSDIEVSWNEIFKHLSPYMIQPCNEYNLIRYLNDFIYSNAIQRLEESHPDTKIDELKVTGSSYQTIKIQLRALGLIDYEGERNDWVLTSLGDKQMTRLIAKKKCPSRSD